MDNTPRLLCRCGFEHNGEGYIEFRRDAVSNRVKLFCQKCDKRLFPEYITTSSREFREIFHRDDFKSDHKTQP